MVSEVDQGLEFSLTSYCIRDDRKETLQSAMAARQKKRTDNIATRNERKHDKKKGIKPGKSKARPGFEGRSFGGNKGKARTK